MYGYVVVLAGWLSVVLVGHEINKKGRSKVVSRRSTGIQRILAVRVVPSIGNFTSTTANNEESKRLSRDLFGNSTSVASYFSDLSRGKLRLVPAEGTSTSIRDGVVNLFVDPWTDSWNLKWKPDASYYNDHERAVMLLRYAYVQGSLIKQLVQATEKVVGANLEDIADRVLFCLPRGVMDNKLNGQAELFGIRSLYNGNMLTSLWEQGNGCASLGTIMHELGHNIGFHHSIWEDSIWEDGEYGDPTCLMGRSNIALNGHKNWETGWFSDRAINAKIGRVVTLYPIDDYQDSSSHPVLVRVGSLFVQSIDRPYAYLDQAVTITRAIPQVGVRSEHVAILNERTREWTGRVGFRRITIEYCFNHRMENGSKFVVISIHRQNRPSLCPRGGRNRQGLVQKNNKVNRFMTKVRF